MPWVTAVPQQQGGRPQQGIRPMPPQHAQQPQRGRQQGSSSSPAGKQAADNAGAGCCQKVVEVQCGRPSAAGSDATGQPRQQVVWQLIADETSPCWIQGLFYPGGSYHMDQLASGARGLWAQYKDAVFPPASGSGVWGTALSGVQWRPSGGSSEGFGLVLNPNGLQSSPKPAAVKHSPQRQRRPFPAQQVASAQAAGQGSCKTLNPAGDLKQGSWMESAIQAAFSALKPAPTSHLPPCRQEACVPRALLAAPPVSVGAAGLIGGSAATCAQRWSQCGADDGCSILISGAPTTAIVIRHPCHMTKAPDSTMVCSMCGDEKDVADIGDDPLSALIQICRDCMSFPLGPEGAARREGATCGGRSVLGRRLEGGPQHQHPAKRQRRAPAASATLRPETFSAPSPKSCGESKGAPRFRQLPTAFDGPFHGYNVKPGLAPVCVPCEAFRQLSLRGSVAGAEAHCRSCFAAAAAAVFDIWDQQRMLIEVAAANEETLGLAAGSTFPGRVPRDGRHTAISQTESPWDWQRPPKISGQ